MVEAYRGPSRAVELTLIFRGESHGPMPGDEAARFVYLNAIPLNAAVRVTGHRRLYSLRAFPELARAVVARENGKAFTPRTSSTWFHDGADYTPNHVPAVERIVGLVWIVCIVGMSWIGWQQGGMPIPGGSRRGGPVVLIGGAGFWFALVGNALLVAAILVHIVDHYDRRNNEIPYRQAFKWIGGTGIACIVLGLVVGFADSTTT